MDKETRKVYVRPEARKHDPARAQVKTQITVEQPQFTYTIINVPGEIGDVGP